ncbi:MAG: c-type cytochrome, partial [Gammaproteobacteria bacterium]|nr:c-type cytochrome [Gammaproteobacteria bacterium]
MNFRTAIFLLTALVLPGLATAGDDTSGKALYATCAACHGASGEGNEALNAPGIAGQSESYLARQLWDFKDGRRGKEPGDTTGAQMLPMAATLP